MVTSPRKLSFGLIAFCCCSSFVTAKDYKVYYLGGQSNMDGYGYVKDLQGMDAEPVKGCLLYTSRCV